MIDVFSSIPIRVPGASATEVQAQVQLHARDQFTGLFHLQGEDGQLVLLFFKGKLTAARQFRGRDWEPLHAHLQDDALAKAKGDLRILSVPPEGLRLFRLLLGSDFGESNTIPSLPASKVAEQVANWQRAGRTGLALVTDREGDSAVLLLGSDGGALTDGALVSPAGVQAGAGVLNQIGAWGERPCSVALCLYNPESDVWKDHDLRVSFARLLQTTLARYAELAGRMLVADMGEQLNAVSSNEGWDVSLYGSSVSNRHYFETAENAARAYARLLEVVDRQMDLVIGSKMADQIWMDALTKLPGPAQQMIREQVVTRAHLFQPHGKGA
jgi:hypothetical protein